MTDDDIEQPRPDAPHSPRHAAGSGAAPVDPGSTPPEVHESGAHDPAGPEAHLAAEPDEANAAPPVPESGWRGYLTRRRRRKDVKVPRKAPWWELPALIALAIGIAILVKTFVIQPFYIPSASMENTLHGSPAKGHDRILVFKPIYDFRDPEPGDIVVFDAPNGWDTNEISRPPDNLVLRGIRGFGQLVGFVPPDGQVLVKRVIATGGQTVKGDSSGRVMVSTHGAKGPYRTLDEPYVLIDGGGIQNFGPVTVPKGRLWVMGDHRNDSADSRYHCTPSLTDCGASFATVPIDNVIGKAVVVAWPPSHWRTLGTPTTFENASAAAAPYLPSAGGVAVVLPLFVARRVRRRRGR